ncbi:MAG: dihydroneopterin aldolase [Candidatus Bipolaricaulota bacterium]
MLRARACNGRGFEGVSPGPAAGTPGGDVGGVASSLTRLVVEGLPLVLRVGWTSQERALPRAVLVDLTLDVAYDGSGELSGTVDLDEAVSVAQGLCGEEHRLLEDVAGRLAGTLLETFPRLVSVQVAVSKPSPPVGAPVAATGAVVVRRRDG